MTCRYLNEHFLSFSISAVDSVELLTGRPYGGLSILWRMSIENMCRVLNFEAKRLRGLQITTGERNSIPINVHLPYYSADNIDDYLFYIGKL